MRAVVQRVLRASVFVDGRTVGRIGHGLLVLLAASREDGPEQVRWMAEKLPGLRVFGDQDGKMNLSLLQVGGEMLIVSQFTLYGDCRKGKRPSYAHAARPQEAETLYKGFLRRGAGPRSSCPGRRVRRDDGSGTGQRRTRDLDPGRSVIPEKSCGREITARFCSASSSQEPGRPRW